jgi:hypothetical protein
VLQADLESYYWLGGAQQEFSECHRRQGPYLAAGRALGVAIFKGFLDYPSALTHYQQSTFKQTVLVLNSASMWLEALPQL